MNENQKSEIAKPKGNRFKDYFSDLAKEIFALDHGVDKWGTVQEVKSKQSMSGANAWMLICSIMIASIGLNLNSQAVIIGAMLISPLMAPILGIGVGVGVNDKDALYSALMHFSSAIIIALVTSTLYFWLTPLGELTGQIEARTEPTFLDILIAIFGGIAGIVSIARKDISTTLPGVAIATALMPPLCVTGYGIANGSFEIMTRSFYLFFLNSFFVAFATYVVIRHMNFPFKKYATKKERRKNHIIVAIFSLFMVVPSIYIFISVCKNYNQDQKVKSFMQHAFTADQQKYIDDYRLWATDSSQQILIKVYGDAISSADLSKYEQKLVEYDLKGVQLEILPTAEIDLDNLKEIKTELSGIQNKFDTQINELVQLNEEQQKSSSRQNMFSNNQEIDSTSFSQLSNELHALYPDLTSFSLGTIQSTNFENESIQMPMAFISKEKNAKLDIQKLQNFLKVRMDIDEIKIVLE